MQQQCGLLTKHSIIAAVWWNKKSPVISLHCCTDSSVLVFYGVSNNYHNILIACSSFHVFKLKNLPIYNKSVPFICNTYLHIYIIGPKPKNGLHYYTILLVNHRSMPFYAISNDTCNLKLRAYVSKFSLDFAVHNNIRYLWFCVVWS